MVLQIHSHAAVALTVADISKSPDPSLKEVRIKPYEYQMSEQMLTPIPPHCQVKFSRSGETCTKPSEAAYDAIWKAVEELFSEGDGICPNIAVHLRASYLLMVRLRKSGYQAEN
ncbi:hypothetical protein U0070_020570 [Myodes glareolus]|uniref:Uncharacterized protein n=1 Tax=Myodes glareolus TaxID=447135 RepID=A0AAW0JAV5_MYOGA